LLGGEDLQLRNASLRLELQAAGPGGMQQAAAAEHHEARVKIRRSLERLKRGR
jgi:hypothetical protein